MKNMQLSLYEQAAGANPQLEDAQVIRQICEYLLVEAEAEPPVDVRVLASLRGISKIQRREQPWAGLLHSQLDGQMAVGLRASDSVQRQRFTILHEVGHTLLPGFREGPQHRCEGAHSKEEQLCDIAASELLSPRRFFEPDVAYVGFTTDGIEALATRYEASIESTAIRSVELAPHDAALLVFRVQHKPIERGKELEVAPKLRLAWSNANGDWPYMLKHKSVEPTSPFQRAYEGEIVDEISTLGSVAASDSERRVAVTARRYGNEVISLIRPASA